MPLSTPYPSEPFPAQPFPAQSSRPSPAQPFPGQPSPGQPSPAQPPQPSGSEPAAAVVVDLAAHRERHDRAVTALAAAPVRHLPAALLDALQGSWGTPQELLPAPRRGVQVSLAR